MLNKPAFQFFTKGEIKPEGWLKRQLRIQADGLSGNLDKVWPDVRDSRWIGGDRDGWERVPYWLDGFIPLAYLLEDEDMIARAKFYEMCIRDRCWRSRLAGGSLHYRSQSAEDGELDVYKRQGPSCACD